MNKTKRLIILAVIFVIAFGGFMLYNSRFLGDTLDSRTAILQREGEGVTVYREVVYDSAQTALFDEIYDADGRCGIAAFVRNARGDGYNLRACEWKPVGEVVHATVQVNGAWYHLFLLSAPELERAEFLLTHQNGTTETWSQSADGILLVEMPKDNHDIEVVYYDKYGTAYQ